MDFGNIFKKLVPLAATAGVAYMAGGSGANLFGSSALSDKLTSWATKEAMKKGMEVVFAGDDDFISPYETANVSFDDYKRTIGDVSKGGVVSFPGPIKAADPETISYIWKQRMNSYIGGKV